MVFARVHDSRIAANADFGPGWRPSLAEELLVDGDASTYVDESGARRTFAWNGTAWTASPPTPRHAATTLAFADAGGIRTAVLADGDAVRTFEQADAAGARYVVRLVRTPARELLLDYDGGRLATVSHDGAMLFDVERDGDGRIAAVRDDHGRSVRYSYSADGRLETVRDLAGSDWEYRYRDDGLLGGGVDPEGRTYLAADYDDAGRVARAYADGRLHDYAYATEGTTVAEGTGEAHTLTRNAAGVTTALESTTGDSWSLALDAANRVSTLTLPARTIAYAYGGHGRVATMTVADSVSGTTRMRSYDYDGQGRLEAVSGGGADATATYASGLVRIDEGGDVFEYEVDDRGRVARVQQGAEPEIRVERDQAGDVVDISQGHRSVRFGRDDLGRIVDAVLAGGETARYFYDELGNRTLAQHGDGRMVEYDHDATGSLASIETTARDGTVRFETVPPPAALVDWIAVAEAATLEGKYARSDRAVSSGIGDEMFGVEGERRRFVAETPDVLPDEPLVRRDASAGPLSDRPFAVLVGGPRDFGQPDYGTSGFGDDLGAAGAGPTVLGVPDFGDAEVFLEAGRRLFDDASDGFEEPPYPVFLPPEYTVVARSTTDGAEEGDVCPTACSFEVTVTPSSPAISTVPAMPAITATASEVMPSGATVSWSAQIAYPRPGDTCSGGPFDSARKTGTGTTFSPDFGALYGGELTITATCSAPDHEDHSISKTVTINGTQPSTADIAAQIGTVGSPFDGADLRRIGCHESGLTQFRPSPGAPLFGDGGDAGIMQICFQRTVADLWNWRSNVARGRDELRNVNEAAELYLEDLVFNHGADEFTDDMWREEAIHRYNAGPGGGNEYRIWVPPTETKPGKWEVVDRGGAGGYVGDVLSKSASCQ